MTRKRKKTGPMKTREERRLERERYETRTRLLEERIERGFASDRKSGEGGSWRERAEARIAAIYRAVERRSEPRDAS